MRRWRWWTWVILAAVVGGAAFVVWSFQSTDPRSLGRTPDIPALVGERVGIDNYFVTVTEFDHSVTHREVGGSADYRSFWVKATVTCDLPPSERCRGGLTLDKIEVFKKTVDLEGDEELEDGLQGGESVEISLSSGPSISADYRANQVLLIVGGPGGRLYSPHKAYFALDW